MSKDQRVRLVNRPNLAIATVYVYDAPSKACLGAVQELTAGVYAVHVPFVAHEGNLALEPYSLAASFPDAVEVLIRYDADELD